jgi:hypothetical protein
METAVSTAAGGRGGPLQSLAALNRHRTALRKRRLRTRAAHSAGIRKARLAERQKSLDHKQALRRLRAARRKRRLAHKHGQRQLRQADVLMGWHLRQARRWEARRRYLSAR